METRTCGRDFTWRWEGGREGSGCKDLDNVKDQILRDNHKRQLEQFQGKKGVFVANLFTKAHLMHTTLRQFLKKEAYRWWPPTNISLEDSEMEKKGSYKCCIYLLLNCEAVAQPWRGYESFWRCMQANTLCQFYQMRDLNWESLSLSGFKHREALE